MATSSALSAWARSFHDAFANSLWDAIAKVLVYNIGNASSASFGAADTTKAVVFDGRESDTSYRIVFGPSWDTRVWYTSKTVTGFTINVSTAPGGSGGNMDWTIIR